MGNKMKKERNDGTHHQYSGKSRKNSSGDVPVIDKEKATQTS